ncbi:hypothetical protein CANARDRAFT_6866 [[Candida] arabinofermentans NRRL YB-2248]|uniref:Required for respiratory growth protein 7, mitochondrial n=1 Tax=[Candida] arabinofermentans NRRL YB-2248 TaxID=983967 RepID=A0A1E4T3Q6_9ASCO|nr:hypothetical protein CANARDRAFT_6866 [[Candida] arabinofermentans NRRL YB-2248]
MSKPEAESISSSVGDDQQEHSLNVITNTAATTQPSSSESTAGKASSSQLSISEITDGLTNKLNDILMEVNKTDKDLTRVFDGIERKLSSFTINKHSLLHTVSGSPITFLKISAMSHPVFSKLSSRLLNTSKMSKLFVTPLELASNKEEIQEQPKKVKKRAKSKKSELEVIGNSKYNSLNTYLDYAKAGKVSTDSTVFQGNLYELSFLEFLRTHFDLSRIIHQGGKDDKGIDIRANWNLTNLKPVGTSKSAKKESKVFETVNAVKRVKPLVLKKDLTKSLNVKLYVQCKCWEKSRVDARMVREINGTFFNGDNERLRANSQNNVSLVSNTGVSDKKVKIGGAKLNSQSFLMVVAPTGFTRQGLIDFDRSLLPLIFVKFSKNRLLDGVGKNGVYELKNYEIGRLESVYCNPMAQALMKGLDWVNFIREISLDQGSDYNHTTQ